MDACLNDLVISHVQMYVGRKIVYLCFKLDDEFSYEIDIELNKGVWRVGNMIHFSSEEKDGCIFCEEKGNSDLCPSFDIEKKNILVKRLLNDPRIRFKALFKGVILE